MAINIVHRRDLAERVVRDRPDRAAIRASLEQYAREGLRLRGRLASLDPCEGRSLSQVLQDALYDEHGLPR